MVVSRSLALILFVTTSASVVFAQQSPQRVVSPSTYPEAANCTPGYVPTFGAFPGADDVVWTSCVFDDGSGAALYVGGDFKSIAGIPTRLAKWDGTAWSALPSNLSGAAPRNLRSLAVWDDGSGPALFAGGDFSAIDGVAAANIAKWDGVAWQPLGTGVSGAVFSMTVFDDGGGSRLIVGGSFPSQGNVRSWDGANWQPLGTGTDKAVRALEVFDAGLGDVLYAGGDFFQAGSVNAQRIASWDGVSWSPLGSGTSNRVRALEVWDDGVGAALYVGGDFTSAGGVTATSRLARWDGVAWTSVSANVGFGVNALCAGDDLAGGSALWVGGPAISGLLTGGVARFDGTSWASLGAGIPGTAYTLSVFDDGSGPRVWVAGSIETSVNNKAQVASNNIAIWDGVAWSLITNGLDAEVAELYSFDDGNGPSLFAGGPFEIGGSQPLFRIGRWDGSSWHPMGTGSDDGVGDFFAFGSADLGQGPVLFAGGSVRDVDGVAVDGVAQWDGTNWSALGAGIGATGGITSPYASAFVGFDDGAGEALFVGGSFSTTSGGPAENIARWDGSNWSDVAGGTNGTVHDLRTFDDGSGIALYACGNFTVAGVTPVNFVARWDGAAWSAVGSGLVGAGFELEIHDDGSGPKLYVAVGANVFRWSGSVWEQVGGDFATGFVRDLHSYDDGTGPALFASGSFSVPGPADNFAKWDGTSWQPVGDGTLDTVYSLEVFDTGDGSGPGLYVGSDVSIPGQDGLDSFLFRWTDSCDPPTFYCTPKTSSAGCQATLATSAASQPISGAGDYQVLALNAQSFKPGILLAGISGQAAIPFFGGVLCLQPPWKRGPFVSSGGSGANTCTGVLATVVNSGIILPDGLDGGPGNSVWHQYWYRDPQNGAGGFGTALSDAVQLDYR